MTRLAILADIHGNMPALEAVMQDMAPFHVDQVVVAGDAINWGPFSAQVVETIVREGWAVIRGNNEYYLLDYNTPRQPPHWATYGLLPWLREQLEGRWLNTIAAWPDEISLRYPDGPPVRVVHGAPGDPWFSLHPLLTDEEFLARVGQTSERTIIAGHSHIALDRCVGPWRVLNPGSVGVPLDGIHSASYMLLDSDSDEHGGGWRATFRRVLFDSTPVLEAYRQTHFVERWGTIAALVVQEFERARLAVYPFNRWRRQQGIETESADGLLEAFAQVDPWPFVPPEYHLNR